jgi:hypothetical protein
VSKVVDVSDEGLLRRFEFVFGGLERTRGRVVSVAAAAAAVVVVVVVGGGGGGDGVLSEVR